MKVSDYVADFLAQKGAQHLFTISGAGNVHLLDSIARNPALIYIPVHHEQAGVMAANAYGRVCGRPGVMLTTSGAGAANAITGVLGAWADSVPLIVLSGQERTAFARHDNPARMWGLQGWDVVQAVKGITKWATRVGDAGAVRYCLERAFYEAFSGRPGPVWLDIPTDIQAATVVPKNMPPFIEPESMLLPSQIGLVTLMLAGAERPVVLLGHGIRLAGGADLILELASKLPVPFLTSWAGADLLPTEHPQHFGHEGAYGSRCANFIVQNCDLLLCIGTRLSPPQVGYNPQGFAPHAKIVFVDQDASDLDRFGRRALWPVYMDARSFILCLCDNLIDHPVYLRESWMRRCHSWRVRYPNPDPAFLESRDGFINSYAFTTCLSKHLVPGEIVTLDAGTSFTCTHAALVLKESQRLISSRGLGEMGFGLPAAIGACFAKRVAAATPNKKRIVLITGDGSIMLNLQELQTVATHRLPIKIFLYENDGYLSIRMTQRSLFGERYAGSSAETGVICPDFRRVFGAFGFAVCELSKPEDMDTAIEWTLAIDRPALCVIRMDPDQTLGPHLTSRLQPDGSLVSPPLEDIAPFLDRDVLAKEMKI